MKLLEDFPFMRDHAHSFPPALWAELHTVLAKASGKQDLVELLALLADSGLMIEEKDGGITIGSSDVSGGGYGKSLAEALASFAFLLLDMLHARDMTIAERNAQLEAYAPK